MSPSPRHRRATARSRALTALLTLSLLAAAPESPASTRVAPRRSVDTPPCGSPAQKVNLQFDVLPSQQGATYVSSVPEASAYSVSGGVLHQDTAALPGDVEAYYDLGAAFDHTAPAVVEWRMRLTQTTGGGQGAAAVSLADDGYGWDISVNTRGVSIPTNCCGNWADVVALDTSVYHTYRLVIPAGGSEFRLYVDGALAYTGDGVAVDYPTDVWFADGTPSGGSTTADWDYLTLTNSATQPVAYVTMPNTLLAVDTLTGATLATIPLGAQPNDVAVTPDRTRVYVTLANNTVKAVDTATNAVTSIGVGGNPQQLIVTPDGAYVYVANRGSGTVSAIDTATNQVTTIQVGSGPNDIAFSPDGTRAYVANQLSGSISVIDTTVRQVVSTITGQAAAPYTLAVTADGGRLFIVDWLCCLKVIDLTTGLARNSIHVPDVPATVRIAPDGKRAYLTHAVPGGPVSFYDTATETYAGQLGIGGYPRDIAFSPDGSRVYVTAPAFGKVFAAEVATNTVLAAETVTLGPGCDSCGPISLAIASIPTTTTLSASPNFSCQQPVNLTATVAGTFLSGAATPTGTVTFLDATTQLGTATLSCGTATITTGSLASGDHAITARYSGDGVYGWSASAAATHTVYAQLPAPTAANDGPMCFGGTVQLSATSVDGATYSWTGPNGFTSPEQNPTIYNLTSASAGTYSVTASLGSCTSPAATTTVAVAASPPAPTASNNGPIAPGATLALTASTIPGATYFWTGPNGFTSTAQNPTIANAPASAAGVYQVSAAVNGCAGPAGSTTVKMCTSSRSYVWVSRNDPSGTLEAVDTSTGKVTRAIQLGGSGLQSRDLTILPNGTKAAVSNAASTLRIINLANGLAYDIPDTWNGLGVASSPDSGMFWISYGGYLPYVTAVDAVTHVRRGVIQVGAYPAYMQYTPDGSRLWIACANGNGVWIVDPTLMTIAGTVPTGAGTYDVAFSADGSRAYVAVKDQNLVKVLDTSSLQLIKAITVGAGPTSVETSPDGAWVYVANTTGGTVTVIRTSDDTALPDVISLGAGSAPERIAFTRDGARAYVTDSVLRRTVAVDTAARSVVASTPSISSIGVPYGVATTPVECVPADTAAPVLSLPGDFAVKAAGPQGAAVTFSALASDDVDGPVPVTCTPASGSTFAVGTTTVTCTTADAAGNNASGTFRINVCATTHSYVWVSRNDIVGTTGTIEVVDTATGAIVNTFHPFGAGMYSQDLTILPNGSMAAITNASNTVRLFEVASGHSYDIPNSWNALGLTASPDSRAFWVSNGPYAPYVWSIDAATRNRGGITQVGGSPAYMQFERGGRRLWVACADGGGVWIVDTVLAVVVDTIPTGHGTYDVAFSADGSRAYVAVRDENVVKVVDTSTLQIMGNIPVGAGPISLEASPDGAWVYVANQTGGTVTVIRTSDDTALPDVISLGAGAAPERIAFTRDGSRAYVTDSALHTIVAVDTTTRAIAATTASGGASRGVATTLAECGPPDTTAPVLSLPSDITADAASAAGAAVTFTATAADDVDGAVPVTCTPESGSTFAIGTTTVTCTAADSSGNSASGSFRVAVTSAATSTTVVSSGSPVCAGEAVNFAAAVTPLSATGSVEFFDGATSLGTVALSGGQAATTATLAVGDHAVTAVYSGDATHLASTSPAFTQTVNAEVPTPTAGNNGPVCAGGTLRLTASTIPGASYFWTGPNGFGSSEQNPVISNVAGAAAGVYSVKAVVGTCSSPLATTTVVVDTSLPRIACPANVRVNIVKGTCGAPVTFATPAVTGCNPTVACVPASGTTFAVGVTTVTCTATNGAGSSSCSFTVTVVDNQKPTIACGQDLSATATMPSGAIVNYLQPTVSDNCPGASVACTPASGSVFPIGSTTVSCTATDASANTASCSFKVVVSPCSQVIQFPGTSTGNIEGGSSTITVNRSGTCTAATVQYSLSPVTATAGADYTPVSGTLTFAPGQTTASFTVTTLQDSNPEGPETLLMKLSSPTGGAVLGRQSTAVFVINDDDVAGQFALYNTSVIVGEGGTATLSVARSGSTPGSTATINWTATNISATVGTDTVGPSSGTLTFGPNDTSLSITFPTVSDGVVEGDEAFQVTISSTTPGAYIDPFYRTSLVTIMDASSSSGFTLDSPVYERGEGGTINVTVKRQDTSRAQSVTLTAVNGTATSPGDFSPLSVALSFPVGVSSAVVAVQINPDNLFEGTEQFQLSLSNPTAGGTLGFIRRATVLIYDGAPPPGTILFGGPVYSVSENGGVAIVTVIRNYSYSGAVTVTATTSNETASSGSDYTSTTVTVPFAAGQPTATFQIPIKNDSQGEGNEVLRLTLSSPGGGAQLDATSNAVLVIVDDDTP